MKLFHLPYVPLKEVLDQMSINHIFFLSLCSRKTKIFVIQTQKHQFKKVEYVDYWNSTGRAGVIRVKTVLPVPIDMMCFLCNTEPGLQNREIIQLNELGTPIEFYRSSESDIHASFCSSNVQSTVEAILNHLYELLGNHIKLRCIGRFPNTTFVPTVQNIEMCLFHGSLKPSEIEDILDRAICLECFVWTTRDEKDIQLRENSKLYDLDTVYLWTDSSLAADVMKRFNGRHAFLLSNHITTTDVIQFLNAWKSEEKFQNLEVISMQNGVEMREIQDAVEFKKVDTKVKHSFVRKFPDLQPLPSERFSWRLESQWYMVRKSDGHVASVMMTPTRVDMGVWNMTENEFLEKFDKVSHMASH